MGPHSFIINSGINSWPGRAIGWGVIRALLITLCLGVTLVAYTATPTNFFRYFSVIEGELAADQPHGLIIPRTVIMRTQRNYSDLRLIDDLGSEIPFVIYPQVRPLEFRQTFTLEILSYDQRTDYIEGASGQRSPSRNIYDEFVVHSLNPTQDEAGHTPIELSEPTVSFMMPRRPFPRPTMIVPA